MTRITRTAGVLLLALLMTGAAWAQAPTAEIADAEAALRIAETAGAPIYAKSLYDEASQRLASARQNAASTKRDIRESARVDALEAKAAAEAASAKASWVALARQGNDLRSEITGFGGAAPAPIVFEEPSIAMTRGADSRERVAYAEALVAQAKGAGADAAAIERAEGLLGSAKGIAKSQTQSDSADYLSYSAEMAARQALYAARHREVQGLLPALRMERTRLAQVASEKQALEERKNREQLEQQAAQLRAQLEAEQASRQKEASELEALRRQVAENEARIQQQLEQDRAARVEAETRLANLSREYELALANRVDAAEADRLRRQIEDQQIGLRAVQERETLSEQLMQKEIDRLREQLDAEKQKGAVSLQSFDEQQAQLDVRARELADLRGEREAAEKKRAADEAAFSARIKALESQAAASAEQRAELERQVEAERARAAQAEAELGRAREALAKQEEEQKQRLANMEKTLAEIAQTRRDERGFIITLPGIYFDTGKAALKSGSRNTLGRIAEQLRLNDRLTIVVEGHTDSTGSDESNQALSEKRAAAVKDALVSAGVGADRVTAVGKGEAAPVATNDTAAGRQQNRRVEIVLAETARYSHVILSAKREGSQDAADPVFRMIEILRRGLRPLLRMTRSGMIPRCRSGKSPSPRSFR